MGELECAEQQPQRAVKTIIEVVADGKGSRFRLNGLLIDYLLGAEIRAARHDEGPIRVFHCGREISPKLP